MAEPRIVSLLPSATEIIAALGHGDGLVGRSHECDFPAGVESLPVCTRPRVDLAGSSRKIDLKVKEIVSKVLSVYEVSEEILRVANPDVIVTQNQCEVCAVSLTDVEAAVCDWVNSDVEIISLTADSTEAVFDDIRRVAAALNAAPTGAEVVERMQSRLAEILKSAEKLDTRPRVACIEWADPLMAAGNWIPEFVEAAGGENLFGSPGEHSPWLEWSDLLDADPDIIVLMPCGYDLHRTVEEANMLSLDERWTSLRAVREGRSYVTDGNAYFNRPGPRLKDSLEMMAEMIHPDTFDFGHKGSGWTHSPHTAPA
ncbi:MAG: cobalamin-binding protein [Alphaproteobacteria bacterium]|nr:cobalamin-binding protein [Alphaproteobacteria bacterium]|tara:strand:- start:2900 stop:3838 length:939 start_codon:yes stop_codon:yes gene_type:complete